MPTADFFFDCGAASSYLAGLRLDEAALRTGAAVRLRPVLAGDLPAEPPPGPAAQAYAAKDLADWAHYCGVPLAARPAAVDLAVATEVLAAIADLPGARLAVATWLRWLCSEGRSDLTAALAAAGIDAAAADRTLGRGRLAVNARDLLALGGYRLPAIAVGQDLYLGHERLTLVELALTEASDHRVVPPGAHSQSVATGSGGGFTGAGPSGKVLR